MPEPPPERTPLRPYEISTRGYGPRLRVLLTVLSVMFVLGVAYYLNVLFGLALVPLAFVLLKDVWSRHHDTG